MPPKKEQKEIVGDIKDSEMFSELTEGEEVRQPWPSMRQYNIVCAREQTCPVPVQKGPHCTNVHHGEPSSDQRRGWWIGTPNKSLYDHMPASLDAWCQPGSEGSRGSHVPLWHRGCPVT